MVKTEEYIHNSTIYKISIGQNKQDNWDLIDKSEPTDIWFHTSDYASAHIVLSIIQDLDQETPKQSIQINKLPLDLIKRCACICKANSKGKSERKVEIIYAPISKIKKTNVVGEVITPNNAKIVCV